MSKIPNTATQKLMVELSAQASTRVGISNPVEGVKAAFKDGETIKALEKTHPLYNKRKGRIFPFFEDDKGIHEADNEMFEGFEGAIAEIAYHWTFLTSENESLSNYVHHYDNLCNEIHQLITYHPEYNYETGEIEPGFKDPFDS